MQVWIMNLKDNREDGNRPPDLEKSKFRFCLEQGIVGIGWVDEAAQEAENPAFSRAEKALDAIAAGDLVWVRDPETKEYYLCQITAPAVTTREEEWNRQDIGRYCACTFFPVGTAENLPEGITADMLVSRSAISPAGDEASRRTEACFAASLWNAAPPKKPKKKSRLKWLALAGVALVLVGAAAVGGFFVHKEMVRSSHPLLPYGLEWGDTVETVEGVTAEGVHDWVLPYNAEGDLPLFEDKANKRSSIAGLWPAEDFASFLPYTPAEDDENISTTLYFTLDGRLFELSCPFLSGNRTACKQLADYYAAALGAKAEEQFELLDDDSICSYTIKNQDTEVEIFGMGMDDETGSIRLTITSKALEPVFHQVPESVINDTFDQVRYSYGGASINLVELLNLCASGYQGEYTAYRDFISDPLNMNVLDSETQEELENGEYGDYLSSSYIVQITGDVEYSIDNPYLNVAEDADILTLLLVFDENDNFIGDSILQEHSNLQTYAVSYMF